MSIAEGSVLMKCTILEDEKLYKCLTCGYTNNKGVLFKQHIYRHVHNLEENDAIPTELCEHVIPETLITDCPLVCALITSMVRDLQNNDSVTGQMLGDSNTSDSTPRDCDGHTTTQQPPDITVVISIQPWEFHDVGEAVQPGQAMNIDEIEPVLVHKEPQGKLVILDAFKIIVSSFRTDHHVYLYHLYLFMFLYSYTTASL